MRRGANGISATTPTTDGDSSSSPGATTTKPPVSASERISTAIQTSHSIPIPLPRLYPTTGELEELRRWQTDSTGHQSARPSRAVTPDSTDSLK